MKINQHIHGFQLQRKEWIQELNSDVYLFQHVQSGARLLYIDADDTNRVFSVAFRTPPTDSTGVAHIMEHSVLCGSRKFPLKEPFVELIKGSMNTFLNAMTYPDKTVYPVASTNEKDFRNLMDVYLDAVFFPRVMSNPDLVKQEGWHYEMKDINDELTYKGVVYNEMKGVYSSPENLLDSYTNALLYPNSPYGCDSGGDPDVIPTLTYERFQEFYHSYYHPSNSYMYLYGKMDIVSQLQFIDEEYLSRFNAQPIHSKVALQAPLAETVVGSIPYSVGQGESTEGKAIHTYAAVMPEMNLEHIWAMRVLENALMSSTAAVLSEKAIKAGLGRDAGGSFTANLRQPMWSFVVTGSSMDKQEELRQFVDQTLATLVKEGIDKKQLEASLNSLEFLLREADFGGYPIGLAYGLRVADFWMYDMDPFAILRYEDILKTLREGLQTDYYERLLDTYLVRNTHKALTSAYPEVGLQEKKDAALQAVLADKKATLTEEEKQTIVDETHALLAMQEAPDSAEALASIPILEREDLDASVVKVDREEEKMGAATFHFVPNHSHGINYVHYNFKLEHLTAEELFDASLLDLFMGRVNTKNFSYSELAKEVQFYLGGFSRGITRITKKDNTDEFITLYSIRIRILHSQLEAAARLTEEMLYHSDYTDVDRLKELLEEQVVGWETGAFDKGHTIVATAVRAQVSDAGKFSHEGGVVFAHRVQALLNDEKALKELPARLHAIANKMFRVPALDIVFSGEREECQVFKTQMEQTLPNWNQGDVKPQKMVFDNTYGNIGYTVDSKVQYVAKGGNYLAHGFKRWNGSAVVMEQLVKYDYLWTKIRVQGGAYGAFFTVSRNGDVVLCSYRDPNLEETLVNYDGIPAFLENVELTDRELRKYIIGALSRVTRVMTPSRRPLTAMIHYYAGSNEADIEARNEAIIQCTVEDIRGYAKPLAAVLGDNHIAVMGSEQRLNAIKDKLDEVEPLV